MSKSEEDFIKDLYTRTFGLRVQIGFDDLREIDRLDGKLLVTHCFRFGETFSDNFLLMFPDLWKSFLRSDWLDIVRDQGNVLEYEIDVFSFLNRYLGLNFIQTYLDSEYKNGVENLVKELFDRPGVLIRNELQIENSFKELNTFFPEVKKQIQADCNVPDGFKKKEEVISFLQGLR